MNRCPTGNTGRKDTDMNINIMDETKRRYTNDIYTAAYIMDPASVDALERTYQDIWDNGMGFSPAAMFSPRQDDEEELELGCRQLQGDLKKLIIKAWVCRYRRAEIEEFCRLLLKGPQHRYTRVRLVPDLELDAQDIVREWNDNHQNEPPIYLPAPDYI